ncbi:MULTISPECIES: coenzyme F420-0:L-glutamate ligase [Aerococcus]|uniref:F420-0--gamma-glutamyl ligase n=1 Tax=Aerococcus sanguinicola TaxID=119206 RepID=A0A5N1GH84_9LACT|nr:MULTISPECIES: coenzyme F420-0:L-glutamate ligase [Aerococcus]KAA9300293.1 F420-0--gamma-glutamyl ligase [Aerococcus sanguinicola]MDK6370144.1 coenzyme F420-0:L-glutamate ligase [Aerococcus sp. UMB9870]MDK6680642.1 coenzyme F420-0:L-glutamate ligase [Aerococcus sp. UMB8608]MDK6687570.1 coenzyme F420-0:L-glutamate ligase [Aerococcus sp. UMB8623]MDK6940592.1 coenzyme F420-0:L-glutamate ligase [Aerococcus sp. UMB8487]
MSRLLGTVVRGLRAPIIKEGDDLAQIVKSTLVHAADQEGFNIQDKDIIAVTESILARAQGNFVSLDAVAQDLNEKFASDTIGIVFPITSRNRFYPILQAIARAKSKVVIQFAYPRDEVGNALISDQALEEADINPWSTKLTEEEFIQTFGQPKHPFTGQNYVALYKDCVESEGAECEIIFSNRVETILDYSQDVLVCTTHSRDRLKRELKKADSQGVVLSLDNILTQAPNEGERYNEEFGLLGANLSGENTLKLFPRDAMTFVRDLQAMIAEETGHTIEVMVYGDGAFKDPVGHIWELADPVVSPGYTDGLAGTPHEMKLKYLADNQFSELSGQDLEDAMREHIKKHEENEGDTHHSSVGTTPRQITDLVGSLADLTSGSGDKGTPFIYIQGYFDNYSD